MFAEKTVLYQILAGKKLNSDFFSWQESDFRPRRTFQLSEGGRLERQTIQPTANQDLKDARRNLVEYLETMGCQYGWTDRRWNSYQRLAKMDHDYNLPPSAEFHSFSDSVQVTARAASTASDFQVNENTTETQSVMLLSKSNSLIVLIRASRQNSRSLLAVCARMLTKNF